MPGSPIDRAMALSDPHYSNLSTTEQTSFLQQHLLRSGNTSQSPEFAAASVEHTLLPLPDRLPASQYFAPAESFSEASQFSVVSEEGDEMSAGFKNRVAPEKTVQALEAWIEAAPTWPDTIPINTFFDDYGVGSSHHYVNRDGVNKRGERFLANQKQLQARQQQPVTHFSLVNALETWGRLSLAERNQRTLKYFFESCGIHSSSISLYASVKDGVTEKGRALINTERAAVVAEEETDALRLTSALACLQQYEECRALHVHDFATATGVSYPMLRKCWVARCELSAFGARLYDKNKVLFAALEKWTKASPDERAHWALNGYACSHHIRSLTWHRYACVQGDSGLTKVGLALYNVPRPEALRQKVIEFLQCREGGEAAQAMTGLMLSDAPQATAEAETVAEEKATLPLVVVKQEPESSVTGESLWEPPTKRLHLALRQNGPLLTDPRDPSRSITAEVFKDRPQSLTYAYELDVRLKSQTARFQKQFLLRAKRFVASLIATDGRHQQKYFERYFNPPQLTFVADPQQPDVDIPAPEGLDLTAKTRIKAFTLLGGYNGALLQNHGDIQHDIRTSGALRSMAYSWTAPADEKGQAAVISAFSNANLLALMNTNVIAGSVPLNEQGISGIGGNKVSLLFVNNIYPVYVTIAEIEAGERFLVPYGRGYNPLAIKQESLAYDDEAIIARHFRHALVIQNSGGDEIRGYNSSGEYCTGQPLRRSTMVLRQRHDASGHLWYDAVDCQGVRLATSPDNSDNLWHALACALTPGGAAQSIIDNIAELKRIVVQEKQQQ